METMQVLHKERSCHVPYIIRELFIHNLDYKMVDLETYTVQTPLSPSLLFQTWSVEVYFLHVTFFLRFTSIFDLKSKWKINWHLYD